MFSCCSSPSLLATSVFCFYRLKCDRCFYLLAEKVNIGIATRFKLRQLISSSDATPEKAEEVVQACVNFMATVVSYLVENLPLESSEIHTAQWVDPNHFPTWDTDDIAEWALRYKQ